MTPEHQQPKEQHKLSVYGMPAIIEDCPYCDGSGKRMRPDDIRSRPHPAPRPPCEECIYQAQAADRARKAREDVLAALSRNFKGRYVEDAVLEIRRFPESLRQHSTQAGEP